MSKLSRRSWRCICTVCLLVLGATVWLSREVEYRRISSPDSSYTAIVTYRRYQSLLPIAPGQSSDKAGFIRIVDAHGTNYGKIAVPMVWMTGDLKWIPGGARLPLLGQWNFAKREYRYWNDSDAEIVRTIK